MHISNLLDTSATSAMLEAADLVPSACHSAGGDCRAQPIICQQLGSGRASDSSVGGLTGDSLGPSVITLARLQPRLSGGTNLWRVNNLHNTRAISASFLPVFAVAALTAATSLEHLVKERLLSFTASLDWRRPGRIFV